MVVPFLLPLTFVKVCDFATLLEYMNVFICLFISVEPLEIKNRDGEDMVTVIASSMA